MHRLAKRVRKLENMSGDLSPQKMAEQVFVFLCGIEWIDTLDYESPLPSREDINEGWVALGGTDDYWDDTLEWNFFTNEFTVSEAMAAAGSHLLYSECDLFQDALMVFDDVSVQAVV